MGLRRFGSLVLAILLASPGVSLFGQSEQYTLNDGIRVPVRLLKTISSETSKEGEAVELEVAEDVILDGSVVLAQGNPVKGVIVEAQPKRRMGRAGRLEFRITETQTTDGQRIRLRSTEVAEGDGHVTAVAVTTAISAVLLWPAAPFMLLRRGKDVGAVEGAAYVAFVDGNHALGDSAGMERAVEDSDTTGLTFRDAAGTSPTPSAPTTEAETERSPSSVAPADVEPEPRPESERRSNATSPSALTDSRSRDVLSNDDITRMSGAGLSAEVIITVINRSETAFDLSAEGLVGLREAEVSNVVIAAMLVAQP